MKAGDLKNQIAIQKLEKSKNGYGGDVTDYVDYLITRCFVKNNSGNREIQNDEIFHSSTITFFIRNYHEIDETMRLIFKNKKYRILSLFVDDAKMLTEIKCELINE